MVSQCWCFGETRVGWTLQLAMAFLFKGFSKSYVCFMIVSRVFPSNLAILSFHFSPKMMMMVMFFRFGEFHAVVSTKQRTMYVSFKRDLLPSDQVTEVHVAFQLPDVLRVYVMGEMVGPASSQAGTTSTEGLPSGGGALYVGRSSGVGPAGQPPGYTLTSVTVWLAGPDALEKVGLLRTVGE